MERDTRVRNWGDLSPKLGKVAPDFDSRFGGIEATGAGCPALVSTTPRMHLLSAVCSWRWWIVWLELLEINWATRLINFISVSRCGTLGHVLFSFNFQVFNFLAHFRGAQTPTFDSKLSGVTYLVVLVYLAKGQRRCRCCWQ